MKRIHVTYQVKPDQVAENIQLIESVFEELNTAAPDGLRYASFMLEDGVTFVHVASVESDGGNPLAELDAFKAFTADIKDRCDIPPAASAVTTIGAYRVFD